MGMNHNMASGQQKKPTTMSQFRFVQNFGSQVSSECQVPPRGI